MGKVINRITTLAICVLLSISLLFQSVSAAEVDTADKIVVTDSSAGETYLNESVEGLNNENMPNAQAYEPDGKGDGF